MEQLLDAPKNSHIVLVLLAKMVVSAKNRGKRSNVNAPMGGVEKIALKVRYRVLLVIAAIVESFTYNLLIFFLAKGIGSAWRFSGDGTLSFNPLLRPIQLPWSMSLSLRTLQTDAFIMCVQIGQEGYSLVMVRYFSTPCSLLHEFC